MVVNHIIKYLIVVMNVYINNNAVVINNTLILCPI